MPQVRLRRRVPSTLLVLTSIAAPVVPALAASGRSKVIIVPDWVTVASLALPFAIAWVRRRHAVGGWLFVYLWEGIARAVLAMVAGLGANWGRFGFAAWHGDDGLHLAFVVAVVPPIALAALEVAVAVVALRPSARSPRDLRRLRAVLGLEVVAGVVALVLDSLYWPQNLVFSAPGLVWPVLWSAYFRSSRRVGSVFGSNG